jgi:hypothetical protein
MLAYMITKVCLYQTLDLFIAVALLGSEMWSSLDTVLRIYASAIIIKALLMDPTVEFIPNDSSIS